MSCNCNECKGGCGKTLRYGDYCKECFEKLKEKASVGKTCIEENNGK